MNHPYLLLVTGPAGAGKSKFAGAWAKSRAHPCARISPDQLWTFIKSGRADPVDGWNEETRRQHEIVLDGAAALVTRFLESSISVVVDDVVFPDWPESGLEAWSKRLPGIDLNMVVLMPSWDEVVQRNACRTGRDNLPEHMLLRIYEDMQRWRQQTEFPVIDNGALTVEETVTKVSLSLVAG